MSELEIAYIATTDLIPYANNPRTHSDQQVSQVASSIKEFGFNNPILIDEHNGIPKYVIVEQYEKPHTAAEIMTRAGSPDKYFQVGDNHFGISQ